MKDILFILAFILRGRIQKRKREAIRRLLRIKKLKKERRKQIKLFDPSFWPQKEWSWLDPKTPDKASWQYTEKERREYNAKN